MPLATVRMPGQQGFESYPRKFWGHRRTREDSRVWVILKSLPLCLKGNTVANSAETICVLGGCGDIGRRVARLLHESVDNKILFVGRDGKHAEATAHLIDLRCEGMALDVDGSDAAASFSGCALCINLTEATPPALAAALLSNGTHFIDSSASPAYVAYLGKAINALSKRCATGMNLSAMIGSCLSACLNMWEHRIIVSILTAFLTD